MPVNGYDLTKAIQYNERLAAAKAMFGSDTGDNLAALGKELAQVSTVSQLNCLELFMQIEAEFPGQSELVWTKAVAVMDVEPQATPLSALEYCIKMMRLTA